MPAYNEDKRIGKTLEEYSRYFNGLVKKKELDYDILVVINNTRDKTEEIVRKHKKKNSHIRYLNFKEGGKGFAVIQGFKDALGRNNDFLGFVDADMATSPDEFYHLLIRIGNFDGVIASRYIKGAVVKPKQSIQRIIASRIFNMFTRAILLIPYRDTQCGAKIFRREAIEKAISYLSMSKWAFDVELIYHLRKQGFSIKEVPTKWSDKEYSKIHFAKAGPLMALSIARLRLLNSPFKWIVRFYNRVFDEYRKAFK